MNRESGSRFEKKFVTSFIFVLITLPLIYAGLNFYRRNTPINNGVASNVCEFVQFKSGVAKSFDGQRLLLFGFSNVLMGIRAETLANELNRPVVNFGLIANMPNGMAFEILERELKSGDTVLLSLPYWFFDADTRIEGQERLMRDLVFSCPVNGFYRLPLRYQAKFLLSQDPRQVYEGVMRRAFGGWGLPEVRKVGLFAVTEQGGMYDRHGDYETVFSAVRTPEMLEKVARAPLPLDKYRIKRDGDGLRQLITFVRHARAMGVEIVATWPVSYGKTETADPTIFKEIAALYANLGIDILGVPTDFLYPIDFFADSSNHLTREGSIAHSMSLSSLLKSRHQTAEEHSSGN